MAQKVSFTAIINGAAQLPFVRIDREEFLRKNLAQRCTPKQLQKAIDDGTLNSGIPIAVLDKLAADMINIETVKVTAISAAAGLPGGLAMLGTIPADLAQFYGHVIRIAQELAYIYGWKEIFADSADVDETAEALLTLFIGVMSGVDVAKKAVTKLFGETAMKAVAKKIAGQALTKTWYYPIVKKIALLLGQKMTKDIFAKGVSKVVPLIGAGVSGVLTFATFKPMAFRLQKYFSELARMTPEELAEYEAAQTIIIEKEELAYAESPDILAEEDSDEITISKSELEKLLAEMKQKGMI